MSMSPTPTEDGNSQLISRKGLTYVNDVQPDMNPDKAVSGCSASAPALPLKHTTPKAPPNPGDQQE
eukprot:5403766-Prorocentrum_lima.AAC.1